MLETLLSSPDVLGAIAAYTWDIDPLAFKAGPLQFRWYGLLFAAGLMQGYFILRWQFEQDGEDADQSIGLVYGCIAGIILGARFGHVFFYEAEAYLANPAEIIKFWKGGLASHGATIGLLVTVAVYTWLVRGIPYRVIADRVALTIPLATAAVRLGNFFNSEIVGREADVAWAVMFPRHDVNGPVLARHPSQLYEVAMGLALFAIVWMANSYYRKRDKERPLGLMISIFLAGYFSFRFGVEFFKEYQTLEAGGLTMGQYLSVPFAAAGYIGIWMSLKGPWKGQFASTYLAAEAKRKNKDKKKATQRELDELDEIDAILEGREPTTSKSTGGKKKKKKKKNPTPAKDSLDRDDDDDDDEPEEDAKSEAAAPDEEDDVAEEAAPDDDEDDEDDGDEDDGDDADATEDSDEVGDSDESASERKSNDSKPKKKNKRNRRKKKKS